MSFLNRILLDTKVSTLCVIALMAIEVDTLFAQPELPKIEFEYIEGVATYSRPNPVIRDRNGLLWYGSEAEGSGLYVFDGVSLNQIGQSRLDTNSLSDAHVKALYEYDDGRIFAGTHDNGLCVYLPDEDRFLRYSYHNSDMPAKAVNDIFRQEDVLYMGTDSGLVICDPVDMSFIQVKNSLDLKPDILEVQSNGIHDIIQDNRDPDILWLLTVGGLLTYNKASGEFQHYQMPFVPNEQVELPNYQYLPMWGHLNDRTLWFATWGGGIMSYEITNDKWSQYRPGEPTQWDIFYQIMPLGDDRLWVCSYWGFGVFDMQTKQFAYYDSLPGPTTHRLGGWNATAMYVENEYELVALGQSGASVVHILDETPAEAKLYMPMVRNIYIDQRKIPTLNIHHPEESIALGSDDGSLRIDYISASLGGDSLWYRHRLSGHDRTWVVSQGLGVADYPKVREGVHLFEYQVSLDAESWMDGEQWSVEKFVPFWNQRQTGFILGGSVLAVIAVMLILRSQQRRRQKALEMSFEKTLAESEMAALRAQINPHFIFNSLNSIKSYVLQKETAIANTYLTKFSHLMRKMLNNSKVRLISITDELEALKLYIEIEAMRFDNKFRYKINCTEDIDQDAYFIPPMLIQPYVENAIWHGLMHYEGEGLLEVQIDMVDDKYVEIVVSDNGIGREAAAKNSKGSGVVKKSYGTEITSDRIRLINQSLNIDTSIEIIDQYENKKPAGTKVVLRLPAITLFMKEKIDHQTR